jgi:restriction endonuclease Mrr
MQTIRRSDLSIHARETVIPEAKREKCANRIPSYLVYFKSPGLIRAFLLCFTQAPQFTQQPYLEATADFKG